MTNNDADHQQYIEKFVGVKVGTRPGILTWTLLIANR